jgi:hypothetical protein
VVEGSVTLDMQQSMRRAAELILLLSATLKKYHSINLDFNQAK